MKIIILIFIVLVLSGCNSEFRASSPSQKVGHNFYPTYEICNSENKCIHAKSYEIRNNCIYGYSEPILKRTIAEGGLNHGEIIGNFCGENWQINQVLEYP